MTTRSMQPRRQCGLRLSGRLVAAALVCLAPAHAMAWGAIAVEDAGSPASATPGYGVVLDEKSEGDARRGAMKECRAKSAKCKVVVTFEQCGAYAAAGSASGSGEGVTKGAARRSALANCGDRACRPIVAQCDE